MEFTQNKCKLNTFKNPIKIYRNCKLKGKMTKSKMTSKTRQKFDFGMEPKITTLLPNASRSLLYIRFVAAHSLPV